jgi:hypothetical protein
VKRAHVSAMTNRLLSSFALAVVLAAALAGCTTTGNTGNVRGGAGSGWENFRAEAPGATARPS